MGPISTSVANSCLSAIATMPLLHKTTLMQKIEDLELPKKKQETFSILSKTLHTTTTCALEKSTRLAHKHTRFSQAKNFFSITYNLRSNTP